MVVTVTSDKGLIVAALLAVVTDWERAEVRSGRRGEYRTTGASMYRLRELSAEDADVLKTLCGALGIDEDEKELLASFAGDYEFQVSYACNRFATKAGSIGAQRLTNNELRTLERAKQIVAAKSSAASVVLRQAA